MQNKKNPKYDLDKLRVIIFNIALVMTLITIMAAFEWGGYRDDVINLVPEIEALETQKATPTTFIDTPLPKIQEEPIEIIVEMDFEEDEYLNKNDVWVKK